MTIDAGRGEPRGLDARRRRAGREQRDVEAGRIGGRGVLDDDLAIAQGQRLPADRAEAKKRSSSIGNARSARIWRITTPT